MNTNRHKSLHLFLSFITLTAFISLCLSVGPVRNSAATKARQIDNEGGTVVAQIEGYEVSADGYTFQNFGNEHDSANDLTAADLIQMFGAEKVCIEGSTAGDCVLYETAQKWMEQEIKSAGGGHCQGMSVSSLRLLKGVDFNGRSAPADWKEGADKTGDLEKDPDVINYITFYQTAQMLDEVYSFTGQVHKEKPSAVLKRIIDAMKGGNEFLTLNVWNKKDGELKDGHAIVPYKVVDMGQGEFRIYVYDNNFPNDTEKFVAMDTKSETWTYRTAHNPNEQENDYFGDATTFGLSLTRLSDYEKEPFSCPFCDENQTAKKSQKSHASPRAANTKREIEFSMTGEGDFLVTDPAGKRVGYDPNRKQTLKEAAGAEIIEIPGGLHKDLAPIIRLPFNASGNRPYSITIFGKGLKKEANADFEIVGPGFVVGFEGILLDPNETLTMTVSPDGQELSFTASADGETPTIFLTTEDGPDKPSYDFEIGGVQIDAGKTMTVKLDLARGKIFFKDSDGNNDMYDVKMTRTNADGTESVFDDEDLDVGKADNFEMDFGKWDGKGKMKFKTDEDGDGFDDEKPVEEENEKKKQPVKKG